MMTETVIGQAGKIVVLRPRNIVVRAQPAGVPNEFAGTLRVAGATKRLGQVPGRALHGNPDDGWRPRALARTFDEDET